MVFDRAFDWCITRDIARVFDWCIARCIARAIARSIARAISLELSLGVSHGGRCDLIEQLCNPILLV